MVKILLLDDERAVRDALAMRLSLEPGLQVVGVAGGASQGAAQAAALQPDVAIVDVCMAGTDGFAAVARLRAMLPCCQIIVLTLYDDTGTRARALEVGAHHFVSKRDGEGVLVEIVRAAAHADDRL